MGLSGSLIAQAQTSNMSRLNPNECGLFVWTGAAEELRFLSKKTGAVVFAQGEQPATLRPLNRGTKDKYDLAWQQSLQDVRGLEYEL